MRSRERKQARVALRAVAGLRREIADQQTGLRERIEELESEVDTLSLQFAEQLDVLWKEVHNR